MTAARMCSYVASGREVIDVCPDCGAERVAIDMYEMTPEGPVLFGRSTYCPDCGIRWHCALCLHLIPMLDDDMVKVGRAVYGHMADHDAQAL
jgi:predicted RNA-binding Zn-ribbon protein involved in translation (DUF1610 family)